MQLIDRPTGLLTTVARRTLAGCVAAGSIVAALLTARAAEPPVTEPSIEDRRLEVMTSHVGKIVISTADGSRDALSPKPLYRYDDHTRGYVDGTVWKWGREGRPRAIVTAELHPNYLNSGPRIVYDLLSLSEIPFAMSSPDFNWSPRASAVEMNELPRSPAVAATPAQRLTQLKQQARRFAGTQVVEELTTTHVSLRLISREIDRYAPTSDPDADGVIFLFANGRNPSIVLLLETDGTKWSYGAGRLSLPSTLELTLDGKTVWSVPKNPAYGSSHAYSATNTSAVFP